MPAALGIGEKPRRCAEGGPSERPLGAMVDEADPAVFREAVEGCQAIGRKKIVDHFQDLDMLREWGPLGLEPSFQILGQRVERILPTSRWMACSWPFTSRPISNKSSIGAAPP